MTIQEVESRKANRAKNKNFIKSGRLKKVDRGLWSFDGIEFYTTSDDAEAMSINDWEQRKAEHLENIALEEKKERIKSETLAKVIELLAKQGCKIEESNNDDYFKISTNDGVFIDYLNKYDLLTERKANEFVDYSWKIENARNTDKNAKDLQKLVDSGELVRISYHRYNDTKTGKHLYFEDSDFSRDYSKSKYANSMVEAERKRQTTIESNEKTEAEAEETLKAKLIADGLRIRAVGDDWHIYYKQYKIATIDRYTSKVRTDKSITYDLLTVADFEPSYAVKEVIEQLKAIKR